MARLISLVFTVAVLLMGGMAGNAHAQEAAGFISTIEDLPLMPGLVEEEGGMVFDSAQGRIVQVYAVGWVSEGEVNAFYVETLPQLGWRSEGPGVFSREREILKVEFPGGSGAAPPLAVSFRLFPAKD